MTKWTPELAARARALLDEATPRPWQLQTSNSWRRIGTPTMDGCVICPDQHSDGHPDLNIGRNDAALICAAPDLLEAAMAEIERLRAGLAVIGPDYLKKDRACCECANALAEDAAAILDGKAPYQP
jgi:hypothetical protein